MGEGGKTAHAVVTGLGAIGPWGAGRRLLALSLAAGEATTTEVERPEGFHLPGSARRAGMVDPSCLKDWLSPMAARRMSPPSKMAVAAAKMAWQEAGLGDDDGKGASEEMKARTAVVVATSFGPSSYSERILQQIFFEGPEAASPMLFTESVANAPAAQIALAFAALGANVTVTQREAGALVALGRGLAEITCGRADRVIVASVDEVSPVLHASLDRFGALCRGDEKPRPFDRKREGFLVAEGAAALLLESPEAARQRGAKVQARVLLGAGAFDPHAPRSSWSKDPQPLAASLARRLEQGGIPLSSIGGIVSGASGSVAGDRLEALVLRRLWGSQELPPVTAPKAVTGEYAGGLLAAAALAAAGEAVARPGWAFEEDPELGVTLGDEPSPDRRYLVSALAAGGSAAWVVLEGAGAP